MQVEQAFSDYVATRWSTLYRLSVLLVGEADADDVTQAALLKTYLSWQRVSEADSVDAYVKKILVNTAISNGRKGRRFSLVRSALAEARESDRAVGSHETEVVERGDLWSRIEVLPPRQRAVVVLRYYEDLSEAEIARTLGIANGTVKAHAAAALKALRVSITDTHETSGRSS